MSAVAAAEAPRLVDGDTLALRPLTVVPEGDEFLVGDPESSTFVVLPEIGVRVLELLRSGRTLGEVSAAQRDAGQEVDVVDFADSLIELGFATVADVQARGRESAAPVASATGEAPPWLRRCFSPAAWAAYGLCALAVVALFVVRPALFPRSSDIFFLRTPVRSLAALTVIIYALAAAHEGCHWLAARAEGVRSRITLNRRLYFLVFEIDLTGLWTLPRRRRYSALLAGMAFDTLLLLAVLVARLGGGGWWQLSEGVTRLLAALTFVQVAAIMSQFWIFVRTDMYAVLITATGCVNLFRVTQLMARRTLRLATREQERELGESHARDIAVARWYRFVYLLGLAAAAWFFVEYFVPALARLLGWMGRSILFAGIGSERFWEALVFGGLIVSPQLLTLAVALRDLRGWRERRNAGRSTPG